MNQLSSAIELSEIFEIHKEIAPAFFRFKEYLKENPGFKFKQLMQYKYKTLPKYKWTNKGTGIFIPFGMMERPKSYGYVDLLYLKDHNGLEYIDKTGFYFTTDVVYKNDIGNINLFNTTEIEEYGMADIKNIIIDKESYFI